MTVCVQDNGASSCLLLVLCECGPKGNWEVGGALARYATTVPCVSAPSVSILWKFDTRNKPQHVNNKKLYNVQNFQKFEHHLNLDLSQVSQVSVYV